MESTNLTGLVRRGCHPADRLMFARAENAVAERSNVTEDGPAPTASRIAPSVSI